MTVNIDFHKYKFSYIEFHCMYRFMQSTQINYLYIFDCSDYFPLGQKAKSGI